MKWIATLLLFAAIALSASASAQETTPFHIWNHKLALSLEHIMRFAVMQDSLLIRYDDNSTLAVSLNEVAKLPDQQGGKASQLLESLYGKEAPRDPDYRAAHESNLIGAVEHKVYDAGPLKIFYFRYAEREIAFIADPQDEERFLTVETKGRELKTPLDSLTRR